MINKGKNDQESESKWTGKMSQTSQTDFGFTKAAKKARLGIDMRKCWSCSHTLPDVQISKFCVRAIWERV